MGYNNLELSTHQPPADSLFRPFNRPLPLVRGLSKASRSTIFLSHIPAQLHSVVKGQIPK